MAEETIRLFVSVEVPKEIKEKVAALVNELPGDSIKPVKPDRMHLTLKFIGETPADKLAGIEKVLREVKFSTFTGRIKGVGVFPNENYVRVVWAGIECPGLDELAKKVQDALKGFGGDDRFSAHLTIARVRRRIEIKEFLKKHEGEEFGEFEVKGFNLMQSELSREGPKYTVLAHIEAEKNA